MASNMEQAKSKTETTKTKPTTEEAMITMQERMDAMLKVLMNQQEMLMQVLTKDKQEEPAKPRNEEELKRQVPRVIVGTHLDTEGPLTPAWHTKPGGRVNLDSPYQSPLKRAEVTKIQTVNPIHDTLKLRRPDTYDGRTNPDPWIFSMETYLQLNNAADDERTVLHVSIFLV